MPPRIAVIGVGNEYRRDDGVGPAVIARLAEQALARITLTVTDGEPGRLLDAWAGVELAIVVDAVMSRPPRPGRIHRAERSALAQRSARASTHMMGIPDAIRLAEALGRAPRRLIVYAVEAGDLGHGLGLSAAVAEAVPRVVAAILADIDVDPVASRTNRPR